MGRTSDSRERLIKSAAALMHQRGYTAVGVKEVCEQAGVNKGSFYHFFNAKRDLVLAVLDDQWEAARRVLVEPAFATDVPVVERFQRLFYMAVASQKARCEPMEGCFFGNLALELSAQDELIRQKLQAIFQTWAEYFEAVLTEAIAAGEIPALEVKATAQAILAYFEGVALLAKTHNNPALVEQLAQNVRQLISPSPDS